MHRHIATRWELDQGGGDGFGFESMSFTHSYLGRMGSQDEGYVVNNLGGGNSNIFGIFTPILGEDEPILTHIFQMG